MLGNTEGRRKRGWERIRWLDGITDSMDMKSEQTAGDGEGQGSLECCSPWGHKDLDMTKWLNNNNGCFTMLCCVSFCCTVNLQSESIIYTAPLFLDSLPI